MRIRRGVLLLLALLCCLPPVPAAAAEGLTLEQLRAKFPDGKYWNHPPGSASNPDGWTDVPCTPHSGHRHRVFDGACGCNCFRGLTIQCEGFAYQLQEDAFGEGYGVSSYHHPRVVRDYAAAMQALKAGDVIRYDTGVWNHSIFITAVDGDRITYADCNAENTCQIRWDVPGTKQALAEGFLYLDPGGWDLAPAAPMTSAAPAEPSASAETSDMPPAEPVTLEIGLAPGSVSIRPGQADAVVAGPPLPIPPTRDTVTCTVTFCGGSAASAAVTFPAYLPETETTLPAAQIELPLPSGDAPA